jgi:hypothetical protein
MAELLHPMTIFWSRQWLTDGIVRISMKLGPYFYKQHIGYRQETMLPPKTKRVLWFDVVTEPSAKGKESKEETENRVFSECFSMLDSSIRYRSLLPVDRYEFVERYWPIKEDESFSYLENGVYRAFWEDYGQRVMREQSIERGLLRR